MTSPRYNDLKRHAQEEMAIFDALPSALRAAIANNPTAPRASVVRNALLRGVSEQRIIELLQRSQNNG